MEKELTIKIDLEKITQDVLENETYSEGRTGMAIIQNTIKESIKRDIREAITSEIKSNLNIGELKESNYTREYLKEEAKSIISKELEALVKEKTEDWVKINMRWIIEKQAEKSIEEFLLPRLQKLINSLVVVNTENVEYEMEALRDFYEQRMEE